MLIDPTGMEPEDDHFNKYGRFMYRDNKKTNNVIIHTDKGNVRLSQLDYTKKGTRMAVSNIIAHYAGKKGLSGVYGVKTMKSHSTGAHTTPWKSVFFNSKALSAGKYDNFYNIRSTLDHEAGEKGHKSENISPYTYIAHTQVYLDQAKSPDYGKSTEDYQSSIAFGFMERLWNSYEQKEISWGKLGQYIDDFNANNTGGVKVIPIGGYDGPMDIYVDNDGVKYTPTTAEKIKTPHE
ncbi:hypothetical protein FO675_07995 [Riemerella anatipestifer]|nr:hypothetical protein [Riemerella anatipestifer]